MDNKQKNTKRLSILDRQLFSIRGHGRNQTGWRSVLSTTLNLDIGIDSKNGDKENANTNSYIKYNDQTIVGILIVVYQRTKRI